MDIGLLIVTHCMGSTKDRMSFWPTILAIDAQGGITELLFGHVHVSQSRKGPSTYLGPEVLI